MSFSTSGVVLFWALLFYFIANGRAENSCGTFEYVADCLTPDEESGRLMDFRNVSVGVVEGGKWGLVGLVHMDFETIESVSLEFIKCHTKQEPESCLYFTTFKYTDCCKKLNAKTQFWSPFFQNIEPLLLCPAKGDYDFKKSIVDLDYVGKGVPGLIGFYWKVKTTVFQNKTKIGCFLAEISTVKN